MTGMAVVMTVNTSLDGEFCFRNVTNVYLVLP